MKLYALPENVLNEVLTALQELPYKTASKVLAGVSQARLVVDANQAPVELTDVTPAATTVPETDLQELAQ